MHCDIWSHFEKDQTHFIPNGSWVPQNHDISSYLHFIKERVTQQTAFYKHKFNSIDIKFSFSFSESELLCQVRLRVIRISSHTSNQATVLSKTFWISQLKYLNTCTYIMRHRNMSDHLKIWKQSCYTFISAIFAINMRYCPNHKIKS